MVWWSRLSRSARSVYRVGLRSGANVIVKATQSGDTQSFLQTDIDNYRNLQTTLRTRPHLVDSDGSNYYPAPEYIWAGSLNEYLRLVVEDAGYDLLCILKTRRYRLHPQSVKDIMAASVRAPPFHDSSSIADMI
jgi:hypothetical protein